MIQTEPARSDAVALPAGRAPRWAGAAAGVLAAGAALAAAELVAGLLRGATSPVVSVGEWVVDHVPSFVKTFAIRTFGTNDKPALIIGTLVLLLVLAALLGVVARRRPWVGIVGIAAFGVVGAAAAATRPAATATSIAPSLAGAAAGVVALVTLLRIPLPATDPATDRVADPATDPAVDAVDRADGTVAEDGERPSGFDRRRFLVQAAITTVIAATAGGVGRALGRRFSVDAARTEVALPPPSSAAATVPAGVELAVPGLTPFTTANADFYRVDTALVVPQVDPQSWGLRISGMVDHPIELTYQDLLARPMVERDITMVCVSNEVGGQYAGHARWLGTPLADLLREVGVQPGANQLVSRSTDGWTAGTPVDVVMDGRDALIAVGMNGEPLPVAHGFPARMVVPGLYGYVSATKWLTELELTTFDAYDAYWLQRGWAQQAPIKTFSRIDTPRGLSSVSSGRVAIAGVAWAVHRGIEKVEVRVDSGPWRSATLGEAPTDDTWRQWVFDWDATPGSHTITCRATDAAGVTQTEDRAEPIPDGASGWHQIVAIVT